MLDAANRRYLPFTTVVLKDAEALQEGVAAIVTYTEGQIMMDDRATAYICENFSCRAPVTDVREFEGIMAGI